MSTDKGLLQRFVVSVSVPLAILVPVQPVLATVTVGQTASARVTVDGTRVPSGTTLISPAVVETGDSGAVVHLNNGEVVAIAPLTTAVVASVGNGVRLAVQKGNVAYTNNAGVMETLSSTETLLVSQEGQIQQGERIYDEDEEERLCELHDWTAVWWQTCRHDDPDDDDCEWSLLKIPEPEVPRYLEKTALLACDDRNDLDLDCDCRKPAGFFVWWVPVAAVAGGAVLYNVITEDDEKPASPSQP